MNYSRLQTTGFIADYVRSQSTNEVAAAYDYWSALWLISLACGRSIYVDRPHAPVYLNLYAIFIAESGITRKSSAIRNAMSLARPLLAHTNVGIVETATSPAAFDHYLHHRTEEYGCAQVAIPISEFAAFMGNNSRMAVLLTDLYDCPRRRDSPGSIARGAIHQEDVWVSFLSASTPEWLQRVCTPTVMEGGFTSRCLFIVAEEPKQRVAWPTANVEHPTLLPQLVEIRRKAQAYRTLTLNQRAMHTFTEWYRRRQLHKDPFNASFETREDAHVLRLAALLSVNDDTWVIQAHHVTTAIKLVASVKDQSQVLFSGTGARGKWYLGVEALRDALLQHRSAPVQRSKLYLKVRNYIDNAEFNALLDTMHESGMITRHVGNHDGPGRPIDLILGTDLLMARNVIDRVLEMH